MRDRPQQLATLRRQVQRPVRGDADHAGDPVGREHRLRGDAATVRPFVYSIAAETAIILAVLVATSLLVTSDPGR